ncbi:MAG: cell wall protein, partial [Actinomycetota bacterium]
IPYKPNGSFVVPLLVRAVDETTKLIDCSVEQCGVVAFADHTRRDDRSQDVFVPIFFTVNP